ncbi:endonuclease/exonuclease/phosphatase family protein [Bacteroidales bacterium OttesenSCG-928-B11]|nr:endonuclease/exonuclease/phosphatase family protein [Bacteroidales bacterium OttesenSCG-928-E04]MDL2308243.1 endonuclease/exonuclease/phosphatase family protein [Bacteroidales bacterium OttesenSCG-928-C03]MDL2312879.1 endonuclease/exonuclease/phosphatase family protein [Bacteroidales bacterium OttesenSCG-928-B11]MDL2326215.1 endonuclease/exonuclease/phosphatase family protein [Bacteroidales bacterium OttesenSCG-928-A14]
MKNKIVLLTIAFLLSFPLLQSQVQEHKIAVIGFYNVENLFDTENDPNINDEQFLPEGDYQWTPERYERKLQNLSKVIAAIAKEHGGVAILGLSEIENRRVMEDLTNTDLLRPMNFGVAHHDSPDRRGVDVGLIYRKDRFRVIGQKAFRLNYPADTSFRTRDQLLVTGILDMTDTLHVIVNHWPSKSGGEKRSMPMRNAAAQLSKQISDSLMNANPNAKVIIMGDLNDNPNAKSLVEHLGAKGKAKDVGERELFNPMWQPYRDGLGSYAYRDTWELIDMIIISNGLLNAKTGYKYKSMEIFRANFLLTKTGSFTGYPYRTYAGGAYQGGYSDHLPVFIILQRN